MRMRHSAVSVLLLTPILMVAHGSSIQANAQAANAQTRSDVNVPNDDKTTTGSTDAGGYRVGEKPRSADQAAPTDVPATKPVPAIRQARIEYVSGKVTWRADENATWKKASRNEPLKQNAQIWVTEGGRAELRFEDGSLLRLGNDSIVTLQTLYRDDQGPFTEIKLVSGIATLEVRAEKSVYQVDAPFLTVKTSGPSGVRIGADDVIEVGVRRGHATIEGAQGKETLYSGDFVSLSSSKAPYTLRALPAPDSWDRWNDARDRELAGIAPGYPVYRTAPVIYGPPSFWLSLDFPFGYGHGRYGYDRGARWHR